MPDVEAGNGRVDSIAVAAKAEGPMTSLPSVRAIAGRGLSGDRYADGSGTFSDTPGTGRDLTLIDAEALSALAEDGIDLEPLEARRNLVVSGVDLNALIGRRFRIGSVECNGARECVPCDHLQRITVDGVLRGLARSGGLRADILTDGEIAVGDEIAAI